MDENNSFNSSQLSYPNLIQSTDNTIFNTSIGTINNDCYLNHYFCIKCLKFPFVKFCKDKKNVRMTCSCFNNKKISIKEF